MKTNIFSILVLSCLAITSAPTVNAQDNPNTVLYEDTIQQKLDRFGLKIKSYPLQQGGVECPIVGQPIYRLRTPILATPEEGVPAQLTGDTTLFGKTTNLRNVFWIHGLNGNSNSLAVAARVSQYGGVGFPARKIRSFTGVSSSTSNAVQLYSEDQGIGATAGMLNNYGYQNLNVQDRTTYDFVIAHSQGGIVGRNWLRQMDLRPTLYDKYAYGIVTFGTPHAGAEVLNNCRPNLGRDRVPAFMSEACQSLGGAIVIPKLNSKFLTSLIPSSYVQSMIASGCDALANSIIPIVMDNYYKATTKDFYVGAPFLNGEVVNGVAVQGLNQYQANVPVVQFYGVEEQPIMWRFMSSTMDIGEVQKNSPNAEIEFGYTDDNQLPNKVNALINDFNANFEYELEREREFRKKAKKAGWSTPLGGGISVALYFIWTRKADVAKENKDAYGRAKTWLTNANDYYLTDLIGARVSQSTLECRVRGLYYCRSQQYNPLGSGVPATPIEIRWVNYSTSGGCRNYVTQPISDGNYHYSSPWSSNTVGACSGQVTEVISSWTNTYTYKENDGVVLAESAKFPVPVNSNQSRMIEIMDNTNHDQMKNCIETKRALLKLYDGRLGRFFETEMH